MVEGVEAYRVYTGLVNKIEKGGVYKESFHHPTPVIRRPDSILRSISGNL
jgi:hypothetical protein